MGEIMEYGRTEGGGMSPEEILNLMYSAAALPLIKVPPKPQRPKMDMSRDPDFPNRVASGARLRKTFAPFMPRPLLDMLVLGRIMGWYPDPRDPSSQFDGARFIKGMLGGNPPLRRDVPSAPGSNDSEPYVAGFDAEKGYKRISPRASGDNIAIEIPNPGAIYDDIESAAKDIHGLVDPVSKSLNTEFHWRYYFDNKTGKIGYTDPVDAGIVGGAGVQTPPLSNGQPFAEDGVTTLGWGHNHGDYTELDSTGRYKRSTRRIAGEQDDFSKSRRPGAPSDMNTMTTDPDNHVYTLGTPSGRVRIWTKYDGNRFLK